MPRKSYGKSGKWIHDRAHHILGKNPEMPKGMAYAISTQQAHKVGKSPKKFRTKEGVRVAREKHALPKNFYKKTASAKKKIAMDRLLALKKLAKASVGEAAVYDAINAAGSADPKAAAAARKFLWSKRIGQTVGIPVQEAVYEGLGGHKPTPMAMEVDPFQAARKKAPPGAISKALKNPVLRKALKFGGLGALGIGAGVAAHGMANSVGLTDTGPADTLADIVAPGTKYSYDKREMEMYIPRYFLEKAAASMAGAVDTNDNDMFEGEPGMYGPEASVIPQQTLETVVPIMQHVDKSDEEADGFLSRMFEKYKETKEESVGRYTRGETEIPLSKQAGRLWVG